MRVIDAFTVVGEAAFANDDQAAIAAGARRDGFAYGGAPVTPGYTRVRQPGQALSIMLRLDDGAIVHGDGVSVQYSGAGGREPLFDAAAAQGLVDERLGDAARGLDVTAFRATSQWLAALELPTAVRYGLSQALLAAAAHATGRTIAETVADGYATGAPLRPTPIFAQCGENRRDGVDRMVLRGVDELPHGLVNHPDLVGREGEVLLEYVGWVRDRVLALRDDPAYAPVLHFDCYGLIGRVFPAVDACAEYLMRLADRAAPLLLRVEHPLDAGSRDAQIEGMAELRHALRRSDATVQIVADEWCNTVEDVEAFVAAAAADMIQVKTPDLGSLDDAVRALIACKRAGVGAYCGGSCTDTERAAQICAQLAMGVDADLLLARPGMGVDEAIMVVRNEMRRARATIESGGAP
jgi:methylaspartate ammonia-lyase